VLGVPAEAILSDRWPALFGARLADAILAMETGRQVLRALRPRCVYIVDAYDLWGRALVVAARDAGVRSVEVQHGIIQQSHDGYLHLAGEVSPDHSQRSPFSPIPDVIVVHGEAARESLIVNGHFPEESIRITGSPQIEAIRQAKEGRAEARRHLGLDRDALVALYFGAPLHVVSADRDHLRAFLECCRTVPGLTPLLRPHPGEYSPDRYRAAALAAGIAAPVLTQANPFELIVAADIVICHNSTTALDAMVLERPVIHLNMTGAPDLFPFVEEAGALPARSERELCQALASLADSRARLALARRHEPYASHYYARCPNPSVLMLEAGLPAAAP
jgi:hypothetical protein